MDHRKQIDMENMVLMSARKVNHGKFSDRYRGSLYRGVSRNGRTWQVLIMIDNEKIYLCSIENPHQAALLYDYVIIQAKGLSSKINFCYTKAQLLAILFQKSLVQVKKQRKQIEKSQDTDDKQIDSSGKNSGQNRLSEAITEKAVRFQDNDYKVTNGS